MMNETFRRLYGEAQAAMHDAMDQASVHLDRAMDEKNDWRAEVIRLRELLWHQAPSGKPACPHCKGVGQVCAPGRRDGLGPCAACKGQGWQEIGCVEGAALRPLAQAACDDPWVMR